jgi:signal transduction histidine kinase
MGHLNKKIIIVEDETVIAFEIETHLENIGYEVSSHVTHGENVQEEVKKYLPDLVLMDINLKGNMNGIEAAHQIRSFSNIPVIFLTAYGDSQILEEAKQTAPHGFLTKPFRPQELTAAIELSLLRYNIEENLKRKQKHFNQLIKDNNNELWVTPPDLMKFLFINPSYKEGWGQKKEILSTINKDFTKIKEYQNSLIQAKNDAEVANRAKSDFLSRMSHEFRTPLNSILGFSQILRSDSNDPLTELQNEKVEQIINSGNHILKLVNDVLDLGAIENGKLPITFETISLNHLIKESFEHVKQIAKEKKIYIIDNLPLNEEVWVSVDKKHLKNVLINLLTNAIKYNRDNGNIKLSMEFDDSKTVRLKIEDTGFGIPKEKQTQIFKPFNAITPLVSFEEGVGLGLSISKSLMELINGKLFFESQVEKGSSFYIELPIIKKEIVSPENMDSKLSSINSFNAMIEREVNEEANLSKISIPKEIRFDLLKAADTYNFTKLENLIKDLSAYGEDGKTIGKIARKYLLQYDVQKIVDLINKTK